MTQSSTEAALLERCTPSERQLVLSASFHRMLTESMPECVGMLDSGATLKYTNKRWAAYTGSRVQERGLTNISASIHPDDAEGLPGVIEATAAQPEVRRDLRIRRFDGIYRWHEMRIVPIDEGIENRRRWLFTCRDIEERICAQNKLRESNRLMKMAEKVTHVGYWRVDMVSKAVYWSEEVYKTLGVSQTTKPTLEAAISVFHPDDREQVSAIVERAITTDLRLRMNRVSSVRTAQSATSSQTERRNLMRDGSIVAIFGVFQDITWIKDAERERQRLIERVTVATQAARVGIWDWDILNGTVVWDAIMRSLYGLPDGAAPPTYQTWLESLHADDRERTQILLERAVSGEGPFDTEFRIFWPNGALRVIQATATIVFDVHGRAERMIGTSSDITELRTLADQLRREKEVAMHASTHDALTGLLNRRGLEAWIQSRSKIVATLLYLDIDGFKAINDRGGHAVGDETLRLVERIIGDAVREGDRTARIGGDEFVVVLPRGISSETTAGIIARITSAVSSLRPLGPNSRERIGMSIGVSHFGDAGTYSNALSEADANLYERKAERRKRVLRADFESLASVTGSLKADSDRPQPTAI